MVNDVVVRVSPAKNNSIHLAVTGPPPLLPPAGLGFDRVSLVTLDSDEIAQLRRGLPPAVLTQAISGRETQWVLGVDLQVALQLLLGAAVANGDSLRLVLHADPTLWPALADIPVELVEVPGGPLILRPQVSALVHLLEKTGPAQPSLFAHDWPLRVLIVRSNPDDLGGRVPAAAPVRDRIQALAAGLGANAVQVDLLSSEQVTAGALPLGPPTWDQVRQRLQHDRYDILVYLGHGDLVPAFDGLRPGGALLLELPADATHKINSQAIPEGQLRIQLQTFPVPVVLLAGCLTAAQPGAPAEQQAFLDEMLPTWMRGSQGVAQALVNGDCGVQFAVGMRYRLERNDAEAFLDAFFQSLLTGDLGDVEAAVRAGRLRLFGDHPHPPSWSSPMVFRTLGREPTFDFMRKPPAVAQDPFDERDQESRERIWKGLVQSSTQGWTGPQLSWVLDMLADVEGKMKSRAQARGPWLKPGRLIATPGSLVAMPVELNGKITADQIDGTFTVLGENVHLLTATATQALHFRGYQIQSGLADPNDPTRLKFSIERAAGAAIQPLPAGVLCELQISVGQGFNVFYPVQVEVTAVTPHALVGGGSDAVLVPPP